MSTRHPPTAAQIPPLPRGYTLVAILFVLGVGTIAVTRYPSYLVDTLLPAYGVAFLLWTIFAGLGMACLSLFKPTDPLGTGDSALHILAGFGLGGGLLSLVAFAFGQLGWLRPAALIGLLVLALPASLWAWRRLWLQRQQAGNTDISAFDAFDALVLGGSLLSAALWVGYGALPPVLYDSMVYHLALPQQYLLTGQLDIYPQHMMSAYPKLHELWLCFPLALSGPAATNAFTTLIGLSTVWGLARLAQRFGGPRAGRLALALALAIPLTGYLASDVKNDITLAFFELLALLLLLDDDRPLVQRLALAGLFAGFATATKYAAFAWGPGLILAALAVGRGRWKSTEFRRGVLLATLAGLAAALPYYLATWMASGSPLYPFLPDLFGTATGVDYTRVQAEIPHVGDHGLGMFLYHLFFNPFQIDGDHAVIGAGLLLLAPFLIFWRGLKHDGTRALLLMWVWQWIPILLFSTKIRFYPMLFLLPAVFLAVGLARAAQWPLWRRLGALLMAAVLLHGFALQLSLAEAFFPSGAEVLNGHLSSDDYLAANLPSFKAFQELQKLAKPTDRVVLDGERRFAYLDRPTRPVSPYQSTVIDRALANGTAPADVAALLHETQADWLLISLFERRRLHLAPLDEDWLKQLAVHLPLIWRDRNRLIFKIPNNSD